MSNQLFKYIISAAILAAGSVNAVQLFEAERWIYFVLFGILVPIAAIVELWGAHRRGPESAHTANRLIAYVFLALGGAVI